MLVKGVNPQDSKTSVTELVAAAGNGVVVFARLPYGEGGEIRREEGGLGWMILH